MASPWQKSYQYPLQEIPFDALWGNLGAFTTIRKHRTGTLTHWQENWERWNHDLKKLRRPLPYKLGEIKDLALSFSHPKESPSLLRLAFDGTTLSLSARSLPQFQPSQYQGKIFSINRSQPHLKSLDYQAVLQAITSVKNLSTPTEAILLNSKKILCEGATTNLLFFDGETYYYNQEYALPGITQKLYIKQHNLRPLPRNITPADLPEIKKILLCGSGKGVASLTCIPELQWKAEI